MCCQLNENKIYVLVYSILPHLNLSHNEILFLYALK